MTREPTSTRERKLWPLLAWRYEQVRSPNGNMLAYQLSVERLPVDKVPADMRALVTSFRKLRADQREQLCSKFVWWSFTQPPKTWKAKKPDGTWTCKAHKLKYTYPCPLCLGHWT